MMNDALWSYKDKCTGGWRKSNIKKTEKKSKKSWTEGGQDLIEKQLKGEQKKKRCTFFI